MKLLASSQIQFSSLHTQYIKQGIQFQKQCKLKTSLDAILAAEANLSKSLRRLGNIKISTTSGLDALTTNVKEIKIVMNFIVVSRYHQIKKFFMDDDAPDYDDHDYNLPGYLITPSGYMLLEFQENTPLEDQ